MASPLMSWLITVLGRYKPCSPSRKAPTVPMLTTVTCRGWHDDE